MAQVNLKDACDRVFKLFEMFRRGPLTTTMVQAELGISQPMARRWIDAASLRWPVIEDRELAVDPRYKPVKGRVKVYRLLK